MAIPDDAQISPDFKTAFCQHLGCSPEAFREQLFRRSLYPRCRPLAFLLRRLAPDFFQEDWEFLERLGQMLSWSAFAAEANGIRSDPHLNRGFLRRRLHLRVSGARLLRLRDEIRAARAKERPA
jgi:hypothetical protein